MANLNAGDILNTVNSILGAVTSQNQNAGSSQNGATNPTAASGGTNQDTAGSQGGTAGLNFGDLGELAKVIQNTKFLDAEKLTALKTGLLSLATGSKLSPSVLLKLAPLIAVLQTVRVNADTAGTVQNTSAAGTVQNANTTEVVQNADAASANQKAWDLIKPFLNDKDKLSSLLSLFGEYGGKLFGILKAVFLRA